jgi:hypothetical protein
MKKQTKKKSKFPDHSGDGKITKKDKKIMAKDTHKTKDGRTAKKGLWYNIAMKKKRGEKMRAKGAKGAPTAKAIKKSQKTSKKA